MRARSLHAHGCAFSEPRSGIAHSKHRDVRRARHRGGLSLGYFSLATQREVTRSSAGRVKALHFENPRMNWERDFHG